MSSDIPTLLLKGAFEEAIKILEEEARRGQDERRFGDLARANLGLAEAHLALGDGESARKYLYRSLEEASPATDRSTLVRASQVRARVEISDGKHARARVYVDKARDAGRGAGPDHEADTGLIDAELAHQAGQVAEARQILKGMDRASIHARLLEARCAAGEGDFTAAVELAEQARATAEKAGWTDALWRAEATLARLREDEGFFEDAVKLYRAARTRVEAIAKTLSAERAPRYRAQTAVTAVDESLRALDALLADVSGQTRVRTEARRFKRLSAFLRRVNAESDLARLLAYLLDTLLEECNGLRGRVVVADRGDVTRQTGRKPLAREALKSIQDVFDRVAETGRALVEGTTFCIPLENGRRALGALYVETKELETADVEFAQALADHAGLAIGALLLQGHTTSDPETGLVRHDAFGRMLESETNRARRHGRRCALLLARVQIDSPSRRGRILEEAAAVVSESVRNYDTVASDGEHFEILLAEAGRAESATVAERLLARLRGHLFIVKGSRVGVAAAVGGAVFPEDASSVADLVQRAREALKRAGPDKYVASSATPDRPSDMDRLLLTRPGRVVVAMVSKLLRDGGDVQTMLRQTLDLMAKAVEAERGLIFLLEEGTRLRATLNMPDREIALDADDYSTGVLRRAITTAQPVLVADVGQDAWASGLQSVQQLGMTSILAVPIVSGSQVLGAVYLDARRPGKRFSREDQELLTMFSNLISRPIEQGAELRRRGEEVSRLQDVVRSGLSELGKRYQFGAILGRSEPMRRVFEMIERVAPSPYPVILEGETGAGKELVAKAIHFNSQRKDKPFLPVNCGAVAETLLESQLFGHLKGAFTGADQSRPGLFEAANHGSLFLDEVEEMSDGMQKKLLRVLEESQVWPVGGREPVRIDVRIIAATNQEIRDLVEQGKFRSDLYYRLNTFTLRLPPLRERPEDLPLLVDHFLDEIAKETKGPRPAISREAMALLMRYPWPGNVRELRNEMRKMSVLSRGEVRPEDLPDHIRQTTGSLSGDFGLRDRLSDMDKKLILEALDRNDWNISRAAEDLGINRNTLKTRMRKHGIRKTER